MELPPTLDRVFGELKWRLADRLAAQLEQAQHECAEGVASWLRDLFSRPIPENWRDSLRAFQQTWAPRHVGISEPSLTALERIVEARRQREQPHQHTAAADIEPSSVRRQIAFGRTSNPHLGYRLPADSRLSRDDIEEAHEILKITSKLADAIWALKQLRDHPGYLRRARTSVFGFPAGEDPTSLSLKIADFESLRRELAGHYAKSGYEQIEWNTFGHSAHGPADKAGWIVGHAHPEAGLRNVTVEDLTLAATAAGLTASATRLLARGVLRRAAQDSATRALEAAGAFRRIVAAENERLAQDLSRATEVLTDAEQAAAANSVGIAKMQYGNALERLVAERIENSFWLRRKFKYVGGKGKPDFVGAGRYKDLKFDITTPGQIPRHLRRPYGDGLIIAPYDRPGWFPHGAEP